MRLGTETITTAVLILIGLVGCRSGKSMDVQPQKVTASIQTPAIEPVAFEENIPDADNASESEAEPLPLPAIDESQIVSPEELSINPPLSLDQIVSSIRSHFPLIRQAAAARGIASGEALSASGAFDHKLEGSTESQPLDFYENYRHSIGVKRNTMWGGQTFAGYRIGRGSFEPWYLERETNKGGEFKAGFIAPLIRDREIDVYRSELWHAELERRRVEPEIMSQIIQFVRDGSIAYWNWVAAGENYRIASELLELAKTRNEGIKEQVKSQEKAEIDLVDNQRIIVSREAKLIDARRKLEQAAVKLSLFYRSDTGEPVLARSEQLPDELIEITSLEGSAFDLGLEEDDTGLALVQRPELSEIQLIRQQLNIALRQARNETWPDVDGGVLVGQDVGEPTSSKRDKSELELEALIKVSVPLERRKALGKVRSLRWKLAQVSAKNQFTADKIVADVRLARAALNAAREKVSRANKSYELTVQMQDAEQELFAQGQSTLFNLNIREKQTAEAAVVRIQAMFEYFVAKADYTAAIGSDTPI